MTAAHHDIYATCLQWRTTHLAQHYPHLRSADIDAVAATVPLHAAQQGIESAMETGDEAGIKDAARAWCLAWRAGLKAHTPHMPAPPIPQVSTPAPETAYGRYQSAILGAAFVVCATDAEAYATMAHGTVAYVEAEIRLLQALKATDPDAFPANLQWLHRVKSAFGGILTKETIAGKRTATKR